MGLRLQESCVRKNPKGKGCSKCGKVHKYDNARHWSSVSEM